MKASYFVILFASILVGCGRENTVTASGETPASAGNYYEIEGFYVFPLKETFIGESAGAVRASRGAPTTLKRKQFLEPNRVALSTLPEFDEQWGYFENMGNDWIFFRDGNVVAAFREESDF